jgi:Flp pilus assembly protein TadD
MTSPQSSSDPRSEERAIPAIEPDEWVSASSLQTLIPPQNRAKLGALVRSMREHGWIGRPIVAVGCQAWTGPHRIAAAELAKIDVPIVRVDAAKLAALEERVAQSGGPRLSQPLDVTDRFRFFQVAARLTGDDDLLRAAALLRLEDLAEWASDAGIVDPGPRLRGLIAPSESGIRPSSSCDCPPPALVYAIGQIGFDFGTNARRDSFGGRLPEDAEGLANLIWTLNLGGIALYAIQPAGPFAAETYTVLRHALEIDALMAIPGHLEGTRTLLDGQVLQTIIPSLRGIRMIGRRQRQHPRPAPLRIPQCRDFRARARTELRRRHGTAERDRELRTVARHDQRRPQPALPAEIGVLGCGAALLRSGAAARARQTRVPLHHRCQRGTAGGARQGASVGRVLMETENLHALAVSLYEQGRLDEALQPLQQLATLAPHNAQWQAALADIHVRRGRVEQAIAHYRETVRIAPQWAEAHCNYGAVLCDAGRLKEAESSLRTAIRLQPVLANGHYNLGLALTQLNRFEEAEDCYRRVLHLDPRNARAHCNLGLVLQYRGNLPAAVASLHRALDLSPELAEARQNLKYLELVTGGFEKGWEKRQWLTRKVFRPRRFLQQAWKGEPLEGQSVLLHSDQGLGDFIQFIRYAPLVRERGARVLVACEERLRGLLSSCPGIDGFFEDGTDVGVQCALTDLPLIFETSPDTVPATIPYFHANSERVAHWHKELRAFPELRIGIAWRGNPRHLADASRSIPLQSFQPLSRIPGVRLFSLQIGAGSEELAYTRFPVTELRPGIESLDETAAIVMNLDLIVTCDTSIAHLAGALGRPVRVALSTTPDWRWGARGETTPWYSTMRLVRQDRPGQWEPVFTRIACELRTMVNRS